jgi:hypothetical protein
MPAETLGILWWKRGESERYAALIPCKLLNQRAAVTTDDALTASTCYNPATK